MRDVDAGKLGAKLLLRNGADCSADISESHNQPEHESYEEYRDKTDHAWHSEKSEPEIDGLKRIGDIDSSRIGAECKEKRVFDDDSYA
jgi:hypothetical protein